MNTKACLLFTLVFSILSASHGALVTIDGTSTTITPNVLTSFTVEAEDFESSLGLFNPANPPRIVGGYVDAFQGNLNGQGAYSVTYDNIILGNTVSGLGYDLDLSTFSRGARVSNLCLSQAQQPSWDFLEC